MLKRIISSILVITLLVSIFPFSVLADDTPSATAIASGITSGDFKVTLYNTDSNVNTPEFLYITGCTLDKTSTTSVTIPSKLDVTYNGNTYNDVPVKGINNAFSEYTSLSSITLPNTLKEIGLRAFYNCSSLTSVSFPASIESIGNYAFYECNISTNNLSSLNELKEIGAFAFANNPLSGTLNIPNLETIGDSAFNGSGSALTAVNLPKIKTLGVYSFANAGNITSVTLSNQITVIPEKAFYNCSNLTDINLGNSIQTISKNSFENCSKLTSISLPNSVISINESAFNGCNLLTTVTISNSNNIKTIATSAFEGCPINGSYEFSNLENIGEKAFKYTKITGIKMPNAKTIGEAAFYNCSELANVVLPSNSNYTKISSDTFYGCSKLKNISIPNTITEVGGFESSGLTSVTLNSQTSISDHAFQYCNNLASVDLGQSVRTIGSFAFQNCTALDGKTITIPASVVSIGVDAFGGINYNKTDSGLTLYFKNKDLTLIPSGKTVAEYVSDGTIFGTTPTPKRKATIHGYKYKSDGVTETDIYKLVSELKKNSENDYTFVELLTVDSYTLQGTVEPKNSTIEVKYGDTVKNVTPDSDGNFTLTVPNSKDVIVTVSSSGYFTKTFFKEKNNDSTWNLGAINLEKISSKDYLAISLTTTNGKTLNSFDGLNFTLKYNGSLLEEGEGKDYIISYPGIKLLKTEYINCGSDKTFTLSVTPEDDNLMLSGATVTTTKANSLFNVELKAWKNITVTATGSFTGKNNILVFDSSGNLVESGSTSSQVNGSSTIEQYITQQLKAGTYTIVAFNKNNIVSSFSNLSALSDAGMAEGTDYAKTTVTVSNMSSSTDTETINKTITVPVLSTSKFTSFVDATSSNVTLNTESAYLGEQVRAYINYAFKDSTITSGSIIVTLPENTSIHSVCTETDIISAGNYTFSSSKLTIPVNKNSGLICVDFLTSSEGLHTISAALSNDSTTCPIGNASLQLTGVKILVSNYFLTQRELPFSIVAQPNQSINIKINNENITGSPITTNSAGKYSSSGYLIPTTIISGQEFTLEASYISGGIEYSSSVKMCYTPEVNSVNLDMYHNDKKTELIKAGVQQSDEFNIILNSSEYSKYLTFTASIKAGKSYDTSSVSINLVTKDEQLKNIPMELIATDSIDSQYNLYTFSTSYYMDYSSLDDIPSVNAVVPKGITLLYDRELEALTLTNSMLTGDEMSTQFNNIYDEIQADYTELSDNKIEIYDSSTDTYVVMTDVKIEADLNTWKTNNGYNSLDDGQKATIDGYLNQIKNALNGSEPVESPSSYASYLSMSDAEGFEYLPDNIKEQVYETEAQLGDITKILCGFSGLSKDLSEYSSTNEIMADSSGFIQENASVDLSEYEKVTDTIYVKYQKDSDGNIEKTLYFDSSNSTLMTMNINSEANTQMQLMGLNDEPEVQLLYEYQGKHYSSFSLLCRDFILKAAGQMGYTGDDVWEALYTNAVNNVYNAAVIATDKALENQTKLLSANYNTWLNKQIGLTAEQTMANAQRMAQEQKAIINQINYLKHTKTILDLMGKFLAVVMVIIKGLGYAQILEDIEINKQKILDLDSLQTVYKRSITDEDKLLQCLAAIDKERSVLYEIEQQLLYKKGYAISELETAVAGLVVFIDSLGSLSSVTLTIFATGLVYDLATTAERIRIDYRLKTLDGLYQDSKEHRVRYCGDYIEPRILFATALDPSGIVYEAFESNTLDGVTATIYKADNSSGDNRTKWNASSFDQVNDQTTGIDGAYEWYVPDGWWQVEFTKTGYTTTTTAWMEVPPPRMNIATPMVSSSAPTVVSAKAYSEYIEIIFSQYMKTTVGSATGYNLVWVNQETDNSGNHYSKTLRLVPSNGSEITGPVSFTLTGCKNYAGTALPDYDKTLTVETRPATISLNYTGNVSAKVGDSPRIIVRVIGNNGEPMSGVTVVSNLSSDTFASVPASAVTDANGMAKFEVATKLPGYTDADFTVDGTALTASTAIITAVEDNKPARPTAKVGSTTLNASSPKENYVTVSKGSTLTLSAEPGAKIYYTLDDTCPCQNLSGRIEYTGPITLNENGYYRIAAYKDGMDYSDRLNINVTVSASSGGGGSNGNDKGNNSENGTDNTPDTGSKLVDVPNGSYYEDAVDWALDNGITNGIDSTHFGPNNVSTRADFITFLWRMSGSPEVKSSVTFTDVKSGSYYEKAVRWAVANGITKGIDATHFGPNVTVTRAQSVCFLYRLAGEPTTSQTVRFSDVSTSSYYSKAVSWCYYQGITNGVTSTSFAPDNDCIRAQTITLLYRAKDKI